MTEPSHDVICDYTINGENWEDGGSAAMNKASPLDTMCSNKRPSLFPYWHLIVLSTLIKTLLYTEFLIKYYGYSFDYLITITNQFTINTHT